MAENTKAIDRRYVEHCAGIVKRLLLDDFGDNQTRMSEGLGISQTTISNLITGHLSLGYQGSGAHYPFVTTPGFRSGASRLGPASGKKRY